MLELKSTMVEEDQFSLEAGASRDRQDVDTRDWMGSRMPDFGFDRDFGWPLLDVAIRPPGNLDLFVQYGVPTFPIAEPPAVVYTTAITLAVAGGTWGRIEGQRITARFFRLRVTDTSGAPNNNIYIVWFVRSL